MNGKPIAAIVGRPNVGKSALFNKLAGRRLSIVEDTPGVTRDRIYADCEWNGREFRIADTGGIEPKTADAIIKFTRDQAQIAIDLAEVIILVCDVNTGVTAADKDIADYLLRSKKPVLLAVNKADRTGYVNPDLFDFYTLGLGEPIAVSALHGHGTGDLLDGIVKNLSGPLDNSDEDGIIKVAVIGKPNAGKSSLVNRILGESRVIVSDIAGTTRDAVDAEFSNALGHYVFIDTAGLRRKSKVDERIEHYSVLRAQHAIERADVCLIMIDALDGLTEQDTKVAGLAHEGGKASIITVNKWDLVSGGNGVGKEYIPDFMTYAPSVTISAATGLRVEKLFELINYVYGQSVTRITTGLLNNVLADAVQRVQPPTDKGKRLKLYYMTQVGIQPPHFVVFCNDKELFHFSYRRYLENQIRATFGLEGTPIKMTVRNRVED
ncbi:MAG: ribosome biogenesis GTPase Der [Oscillospiraceae bacterium]|jgi:GTP-binding protein|nr:ribosome biogenesis GTPase Der [Oscillospiraceae bacterium]